MVFGWFLVGFHGFLSWFHGFSWFLVGFHGFSRCLLELLEQLCRISWRRGTRSLRCEKPRESRLCAPPRIRRRPPSRSPLLRTRPRRRPRRQQRTLPRPDPAGLAASDKYFAVEFL